MSTYTIELRYLIENKYPIFDFDYPIFDPTYKAVLEQKILNRFLFREIGFETPARFKHYLKTKMNEIMPYYNQLYHSESFLKKKDFNPLYNLDTTETQTRSVIQDSKVESEGETTQNGSNQTKEIYQDTPQSRLGNTDYATSITSNDGSGTNSELSKAGQTGLINTTEEYVNKVMGSGGLRYPADIIKEYRTALLNIDMQILDELEELFMGVY